MSCAVTFGRPCTDVDHVELGAERAHQLEALLGEAVGDHDQRAVALRAADERDRGAGAAAGVLDDRVARRDEPVPLGALDHRLRHPVLQRAGRVRVLELQPELGAVLRRAVADPNERRVPDRLEDRLHGEHDPRGTRAGGPCDPPARFGPSRATAGSGGRGPAARSSSRSRSRPRSRSGSGCRPRCGRSPRRTGDP